MKVLRNPAVLVIIGFFVAGAVLSLVLSNLLGFKMLTPKPSFAAEPIFDLGPLHFSNSMLMTLIVMAAIVLFFWWNTRHSSLVPGRGQNFAEMIIEFLVGVVESTAGKKTGRVIFPLIATLFIFILTANYSGLLPGIGSVGLCRSEAALHAGATTPPATEPANTPRLGGCAEGTEFVPLLRSPNADLNTTLAMALIAVVVVQVAGVLAHGVGGYLKELTTPVLLAPIHIIGEFSRIISLSARLFGNIFGGEVLLAVMYFLLGSVLAGFGVFVFLGLELLFGAIQALVFTFLTTVYISMAVAGHGDAEGHNIEHNAAGVGIPEHPASGMEVHMG
ncbi:MAG: F0F1 ATP synthase subunit A [Chloroflexota bacterium]|nr:F0F1 ATP synthase subunit A [Chloroflexota bacterium]